MKHTTLALVIAALVTAVSARAQGPGMNLLGVEAQMTSTSPAVVTQSVTASAVATDAILARLGDDPAEYGAFVATRDSGFDPHTDTPAFNNFLSTFGPKGTCLGMSFICRQMYLRLNWRKDRPQESTGEDLYGMIAAAIVGLPEGKHIDIDGWANVREASRDAKVDAALRRAMSLGHLRNVHPQSIHHLLRVDSWASQLERLEHFLSLGRPVLLSMNQAPSISGHAILAYKTVQYEKKTLIFTWDCNLGPRDDNPQQGYDEGANDSTYKSVFVYDRATDRIAFHQRYAEAAGYGYDNFFLLQNPDLPLAVSRVTRFLTETIPNKIGEYWRKIPSLT